MRKHLSRSLLGSLGAVVGPSLHKSLWQPIDSFESYIVQVVFTGSPVGNMSLLVSADPVDLGNGENIPTIAPVNYDKVSNSQIAMASVTTGPSGSFIVTYEVVKSSGNWIAVYFELGSGSGVITSINFVGKGSMV